MSAAPPVYKCASMLKVVLIPADENDHQRREDGRAGREADGKKEQAESDEPVLVSLREPPPRPLLSFRAQPRNQRGAAAATASHAARRSI